MNQIENKIVTVKQIKNVMIITLCYSYYSHVYFILLNKNQEFACNGTVVEHPEYGEVLQLQGDQRENICQWLTKCGLAKSDQLKVHGF